MNHTEKTTKTHPVQPRTVLIPPTFATNQIAEWAEGSTYGAWKLRFNGYGLTGIVADPTTGTHLLQESPAIATAPEETHSALVTSILTSGDLDATFQLRAIEQLRTGSTPNPWEVGWVLWHYSDNVHFYYFYAGPSGWELGKENPNYRGNQDFLATGQSPTFPIGQWYLIRVRQIGNAITVWVNGRLICSIRDPNSPYRSGSMGLYDEDAVVQFAGVRVTPSLVGG